MSWSDGTVSFEIWDWEEPPPIHIEVPIRETVLRSLGPAQELRGLLERLGGPDAVLGASYTLDELVDLGLDEREYELLSLVDGRLSLAQLSAHGPLPGRGNAASPASLLRSPTRRFEASETDSLFSDRQ